MPRVPYADEQSVPAEIIEPIKARRGGTLLNLDRMLLNSLPYARGWNGLLGAVRNELSLPARLRELAICAVSALTDTEYEWQQHAPVLLSLGGTAEQLAALRDVATAVDDEVHFAAAERATLRLALELTRDATVSDAGFAMARAALPDTRQIVELVAVIATFNMVSRFLNGLGVELEQ